MVPVHSGPFYQTPQVPGPQVLDPRMMVKPDSMQYPGYGGCGGGPEGTYMTNRGPEYAAIQHVPGTYGNYANGSGYYSEEAYPSYYEYPQNAPCEGGPGPWNFNYCYGFFGEAPCPYANVIDLEDFM